MLVSNQQPTQRSQRAGRGRGGVREGQRRGEGGARVKEGGGGRGRGGEGREAASHDFWSNAGFYKMY